MNIIYQANISMHSTLTFDIYLIELKIILG